MRARLEAIVLACACACGRVGFDARADGDVDADTLGQFSAPMAITELDSASGEDDPSLTGDLLEMYFDSNRPTGLGSEDIYRSVRDSTSVPWGAPQLVTELSSPATDLAPGISPDGLTIYLSTPGGGGLDIFVATRPDRGSSWGTPTLVVEVSEVGEDTNAQPSADGRELWFCSRRGGANDRQLYLATRSDPADPWSMPAPVDGLNTDSNTYTGDPWPSADGKVLYFVTSRTGGEGLTDIWRVDRPTPTTFGTPMPVEELNDASGQHDPWLSPDQRIIYYTTRVGGANGLVTSMR